MRKLEEGLGGVGGEVFGLGRGKKRGGEKVFCLAFWGKTDPATGLR